MSEETAALPFSVKDALAIWDEGKPLQAFRVNADTATQDQIYAAAFEMIRSGDLAGSARDYEGLTVKEAQSAHSIAFVALRDGWARMVHGHIHSNSPAITVKKP
jgi:hypothetical protein